MVKIYALFDPRYQTVVRYVGKTERTLDARLRAHIWESGNGLKSHRWNYCLSQNRRSANRMREKIKSSVV